MSIEEFRLGVRLNLIDRVLRRGVRLPYPKGIKMHTCIVGQSGCGKTSLLSRFVEELILNKIGSIIILDYNDEFRHFKKVDPINWEEDDAGKRIMPSYKGDGLEYFKPAWAELSKKFKVLKPGNLHILFENITPSELRYLFGIDKDSAPGACWLSELFVEEETFSKTRRNREKARRLPNDFLRWSEGRVKASEKEEYGDIPDDVNRLTDRLDLITFLTGVRSITKAEGSPIFFGESLSGSHNIEEVAKCLLDPGVAVILNLLDFKYEEYLLRNFIVLHAVKRIWAAVINRTKNLDGNDPGNTPVFIVVDEAHNVIPNFAEGEIIDLFKTVAAEGRKFGLFLILTSQRPEKIHPHILSECDNLVVMKSRPASLKYLAKDHPGIEPLESYILKQRKGETVLLGFFTDWRPLKLRVGIRRTKKGDKR